MWDSQIAGIQAPGRSQAPYQCMEFKVISVALHDWTQCLAGHKVMVAVDNTKKGRHWLFIQIKDNYEGKGGPSLDGSATPLWRLMQLFVTAGTYQRQSRAMRCTLSKAFYSCFQVDLQTVLKAAGWLSMGTFTSFYLEDL